MGLFIMNLLDGVEKHGFEIVEEYKNGVSGALVYKVRTPDGYFIFKSHPARSKNELLGYELLSKTPYKNHLPVLIRKYSGDSTIVYKYCEGENMRNAIKYGLFPDDILFKSFRYCLTFMIRIWSDFKLRNFDKPMAKIRSVQREEWNETCVLLNSVVARLSGDLNISKKEFMESKILINGQHYESFNVVFDSVNKLILSKIPLKNLILAHGDITSSNVIINYSDNDERNIAKKLKFIDLEWTGFHDVAEIFAKVMKTKVAHISQLPIKATLSFNKKTEIIIEIKEDTIPKVAIKMQNYAVDNLNKYENKLKLRGFRKRVLVYMAGFSLRDMVLSSKRGGKPDEIYALANSVRLASLAK